MPRGLLTLGQLALQRLQLQVLRGPGQLADLPALLVHEVDGDGLAGDQQGHQDGERGEGGSAAEDRPAGHRGTRSRSWCSSSRLRTSKSLPNAPYRIGEPCGHLSPNLPAATSCPLTPRHPKSALLRGARLHPDKCKSLLGTAGCCTSETSALGWLPRTGNRNPRWGDMGAPAGLGCLGHGPTRGAVRPPEAWLVPGVRKHVLIYFLFIKKKYIYLRKQRSGAPALRSLDACPGCGVGIARRSQKKGKRRQKMAAWPGPEPSRAASCPKEPPVPCEVRHPRVLPCSAAAEGRVWIWPPRQAVCLVTDDVTAPGFFIGWGCLTGGAKRLGGGGWLGRGGGPVGPWVRAGPSSAP